VYRRPSEEDGRRVEVEPVEEGGRDHQHPSRHRQVLPAQVHQRRKRDATRRHLETEGR